jgi:hypothetical protein
MAMYGLLALGWYSRQLEYEADLFACEADGTTPFVQALTFIALETGASPERSGWLHPSLASRLQFVRAAAEQPQLAQRFRRRLAGYAWLIALLYLLSFAAVALSNF